MAKTDTPIFYLASSEGYDLEEPRRCTPIRRLRGEQRDDYLLVEVDPPLLGQRYGLGGRDVRFLILATRHVGASLFPIAEWPVFVHVARPLIDDATGRETISVADMEEIAWAELYQTEDAARKKAM